MRLTGTQRPTGPTHGAVRVEDTYPTSIDDVWSACTEPARLARWIAEVSGDLQPGGVVQATFASSWSGMMRIEKCEAPRHLLITSAPDTEDETQIEAWLTVERERTRLVVEERGLPIGATHFYGAGWQVHLEDLKRELTSEAPVHPDGWSAERPASEWKRRWDELTPAYKEAASQERS